MSIEQPPLNPRVLLALAVGLALALPTSAAAAGDIYTVAGNTRTGPLGEGGLATAAGLHPFPAIASLPGGGFLVVDGNRVRRVGRDGHIRTVAGTGAAGFTGDGGPAAAARLRPSEVAALPGGGFLIAECDNNRVRRVGVDGTITTVAGSGPVGEGAGSFAGDGGQATAARLDCPISVAALPGGGFAIADFENRRVRRVGAGGVIETVAGNGNAGSGPNPGEGQPATAVGVWPRGIAASPGGSILIADWFSDRVRRFTPGGAISTVAGNGHEGRRPDDGDPATQANVTPYAVTALPGGAFALVDEGDASAVGEEPRVRLVSPAGVISTVAGSGRFLPDPPRGDERLGSGGPARATDLLPMRDVESLPDGGLLIGEGVDDELGREPGLVRYVTPASPGLFAAALRRDRDRIFTPGHRPHVSVSLTAAAQVKLTLKGRRHDLATLDASLPAGTTRLEIPRRLGRAPRTVTLLATGTGGGAFDHYTIFPRGWLTMSLAHSVAGGIVFTATNFGATAGDGVLGCRRFGPGRVDCQLSDDARSCGRVVEITLRGKRLRWGSYSCGYHSHPRFIRRSRPLRRSDWSCEVSDTSCPPALFGRLQARELVPWG